MLADYVKLNKSQSPYGAKWLATRGGAPPHEGGLLAARRGSRNPLTGLSSLQPSGLSGWARLVAVLSQSPYGAKWFATWPYRPEFTTDRWESQSPYGAKWFATLSLAKRCAPRDLYRRNPLTGLSGLQRLDYN